jgi:hypothetical protein
MQSKSHPKKEEKMTNRNANAIKEEKHKMAINAGEVIREEAKIRAAAEAWQKEEKTRMDMAVNNEIILNNLRDFLMRHRMSIREIKIPSLPLPTPGGQVLFFPAEKIIIEFEQL